MEDNQHIIEYLDYYVKINDPRFAVLLKGKWGCGKTFFIKELINKWNLQISDCKDKIILKPIYISLYGISSVIMISDKLRSELNPLLYSKEVKFIKNLLVGTLRLTKKINLSDGGIQDDDDLFSYDINPINLLGISNKIIGGDKILIFDDLERCKIPLDELFGYINNFVEHHHCKVIFIADEDKINKENKYNNFCYNDFKEKLIGKTFEIVPDYHKAIDSLLHQSGNKSIINNNELITDIFISSKIYNLRILRQCLLEFSRFEKLFDTKFKNDTNYSDFIKILLGYFVIIFCEYKNGNSEIELVVSMFEPNFITKKEPSLIFPKYATVFINYDFCELNKIIDPSLIFSFIKEGKENIGFLDISLRRNIYFSTKHSNSILTLSFYLRLSSIEFEEKFKEVKSIFEKKECKTIIDVLNIYDAFSSLIQDKLIKYSKKRIVNLAKANIDAFILHEHRGFDNKMNIEYFIFSDDPEFIEIFSYYCEKCDERIAEISINYIKDYFENFDSIKCKNIYRNLKEPNQFQVCYESEPIFKYVDVEKFAKEFFKLDNHLKTVFSSYLSYRYPAHNDLVPYHVMGDLDFLIKLKKILKKEVKTLKSIDRFIINNLIKVIDTIVIKIKTNPNLEKSKYKEFCLSLEKE